MFLLEHIQTAAWVGMVSPGKGCGREAIQGMYWIWKSALDWGESTSLIPRVQSMEVPGVFLVMGDERYLVL